PVSMLLSKATTCCLRVISVVPQSVAAIARHSSYCRRYPRRYPLVNNKPNVRTSSTTCPLSQSMVLCGQLESRRSTHGAPYDLVRRAGIVIHPRARSLQSRPGWTPRVGSRLRKTPPHWDIGREAGRPFPSPLRPTLQAS